MSLNVTIACTHEPMSKPKYLSIKEAAFELQVDRNRLARDLNSDTPHVKATKIGKRWVIYPEEIARIKCTLQQNKASCGISPQ